MLFDFFKKNEPLKLPVHTDIHCHIVPDVDDGSPDVETSGQLMERMVNMGLNRIFCSPHVTQDTFENTPETLAEPFAQLQAEARRLGLDVELHHHAEYRLDEFFVQQMEAGNLRPLPQNYLLVENSFSIEPFNLEQLLFDLRVAGFQPILAHPERYYYYGTRHPQRYKEIHDKGTLFQINLLSLSGHYGKQERKVALDLLKEGMVDFVGTDLHRHSHADSLETYLKTSTAARDFKLMTSLRNDTL